MPYAYNCIMLGYNPIKEIKNIQESIDKEDLYLGDNDDDDSYGLEKEAHVTLLYGLDKEVTWNDIKKYLLPLNKYIGIIHNISLFQNPKFDVLKMDIESDNMVHTNKKLRDNFPYKEFFPDYHPHLTIAYLRPGTGKKYVKNMLDKFITIKPIEYLYSYGGGEKYEKEKHTTLNESNYATDNMLLLEALSFNDNVAYDVNDIYQYICNNIKNSKIQNGVKNLTFEYNLKSVNMPITFNIECYWLNNKKQLSNNILNKLNCNISLDNEKCNIITYAISGIVNEVNCKASLQHELNHLYQNFYNKQQPVTSELYQYFLSINDNVLNNITSYDKFIASVIYWTRKYEQDSFVQELYYEIKNKKLYDVNEAFNNTRIKKILETYDGMLKDYNTFYNEIDETIKNRGIKIDIKKTLFKAKKRIIEKFGKVFKKAYDDANIVSFDGSYGLPFIKNMNYRL